MASDYACAKALQKSSWKYFAYDHETWQWMNGNYDDDEPWEPIPPSMVLYTFTIQLVECKNPITKGGVRKTKRILALLQGMLIYDKATGKPRKGFSLL